MTIISIGEILWDVFDKEEHIGGATFNFSAHAAKLGHNALVVSAVGEDERGERALTRMKELGLSTRFVRRTKEAATGHVTVFVDKAGQPDFTIHRPAAYDFPSLSDADVREIQALQPEWIYFGTIAQLSPQTRTATKQVIGACPQAKRLYDINLRKESYNAELVRELMSDATYLKINDQEVAAVRQLFGAKPCTMEDFCRTHANEFNWEGVCVTRGAAGSSVFLNGEFFEARGYKVKVVDTVGAGDAFAAAFVHGVGTKWSAQQIADFANRVGALVASRAGGVPDWTMEEARRLSPSA